jgi:hypothetical protein
MTHRIHVAGIYEKHLPSIYPSHVSICTSTMDPMGEKRKKEEAKPGKYPSDPVRKFQVSRLHAKKTQTC